MTRINERMPLPTHERIADMPEGRGRAGIIRRLYAKRATVPEIALYVGASVAEVRRTLFRPVWMKR